MSGLNELTEDELSFGSHAIQNLDQTCTARRDAMQLAGVCASALHRCFNLSIAAWTSSGAECAKQAHAYMRDVEKFIT